MQHGGSAVVRNLHRGLRAAAQQFPRRTDTRPRYRVVVRAGPRRNIPPHNFRLGKEACLTHAAGIPLREESSHDIRGRPELYMLAYAVICIQRIPDYPEQPNPGFAFQPDQGYIPFVINEKSTRLNVRLLQLRRVALQTGFGPLLRKVRHGVHTDVARPVFSLEHNEITVIVGNLEPRTTGMRSHEMNRLALRVVPRLGHRPHAVTPPSIPDRRAVINGDLVQKSPWSRLRVHTASIHIAAHVRVMHRHKHRIVGAETRAYAVEVEPSYIKHGVEVWEAVELYILPSTRTELQRTYKLLTSSENAPVHHH